MRIPDNARIHDLALVTTTRNAQNFRREPVQITEMHLVSNMGVGEFLRNQGKKKGNPESKLSYPTGFVPVTPGGQNVILGFDQQEPAYQDAADGTSIESHPSAIVELVVMKTGNTDPTLGKTIYCVASAVDQVIEALITQDPFIEFILIHELNGMGTNGRLSFAFKGHEWTHPKTEAWLKAIGRMEYRRREIAAKLVVNPERYGTHAIGCMKFTPIAAAKLRKRAGWKSEFEEFVCTCGHKRETNEFASPSIP